MNRLTIVALMSVTGPLFGEPTGRPDIAAVPQETPVRVHRTAAPGFSVMARLDESRAVSRRMSAEGGTISATAADGTLFTLTLPAGALWSEEDVTLTPVTAIDRLPLSGGLSSAVQLAPEGLLLFEPATLVIDSPVPISADQETTFAWRGTGEEFFLYPPDPLGASAISLTLTHFSGYGGGRGTGADQAAQLSRVPSRAEDRLAQTLFAPASGQRRARRGGKAPGQGLVDAATSVLSEYFLKILGPLQPTNCSDDWEGFLVKLDGFDASVTDLAAGNAALLQASHAYSKSLYDLIAGCYEKDYQLCRSNKDPEQGGEMYRIYQALARNGASVVLDRDKITRCLTFQLDFDSTIQEQQFTGLTFAFNHQVSAVVHDIELSPFANAPPRTVSGEIRYDVAGYTGGLAPETKCTLGTTGASSVFDVKKLTANFNVFAPGTTSRSGLAMEYDAGHPIFTATLLCSGAPVQLLEAPRWREIYEAHRADFTGNFHATGWKKVISPIYATLKYEPPPDTFSSDELDVFTLTHTPK